MNYSTECPHHLADCEGFIYTAFDIQKQGLIRVGFSHSAANLRLRNIELLRSGFRIAWNSGPRDHHGIPWRYSDEQRIHYRLWEEGDTPYLGREWYSITRHLITVLDEEAWSQGPKHTRHKALRDHAAHLRRGVQLDLFIQDAAAYTDTGTDA